MALLKLVTSDGLSGPVKKITLRTEEIEAIWTQESPTMGYELVNLLFKSGETIRLDVAQPQTAAIWAKIEGAL